MDRIGLAQEISVLLRDFAGYLRRRVAPANSWVRHRPDTMLPRLQWSG
jgi:hypothetical protein